MWISGITCALRLASYESRDAAFAQGTKLTSSLGHSTAWANWKGIGFSGHNVPSLSNTAIRSDAGTNLGLAWAVVSFTKVTMACFAGPSFHDGSGSMSAYACVPRATSRTPNSNERAIEGTTQTRCMIVLMS